MRFLPPQAIPILHAVWRHKWLGVATAWLICTAGWIGVALVPTKYESTARVYLNADPLLTPLLRGLAADTDPTRQLDFMQRTLLSRPNLEQLVRLTDLDIGVTTAEQKEALYKRLASDVSVAPVTLNLLTLSYRDRDPVMAKNVVQSLLTIFAEKTAGSSRADMDNAQRFLDSEINSYRDQLRAAEKRRAELAQQYPDIVSNRPPDAGTSGDESLSRLDQAHNAVTRLKLDLADAVTKRDALQKELAAVPPMLSVERAPQVVVTGGRLAPVDERLQEIRRNLDGLLLKYTENHPDVKSARQAIAHLEAEGSKSSGGAGKSGGASTKGEIANTVYEQIKVRLVDAEAAVAAVQRRLDDARSDQERIEKVAASAPGVLVQAQDLDRDYSILKRNYQELVARREATQIANAADTKTEKIQFRIVDPPQVPILPAAPNRAMLVSMVLLFGIGGGIAVPLALTQIDRSFATVGQLRNLGLPILGSVSRLSLGTARRRAVIQLAGVCASAFLLIAVYGTLIALSMGLHTMGVS
ncbi:MAG TPA: XrtA system polysaccharide chain length determinant [Stellaceae bacterium]|nr:XrtA system polysaccharide chain length determinant [Stellaceae bacterium]